MGTSCVCPALWCFQFSVVTFLQVLNADTGTFGAAGNMFCAATIPRCIKGVAAHLEQVRWEIAQGLPPRIEGRDRRPPLVKIFLCVISNPLQRQDVCRHALEWASNLEAAYASTIAKLKERGLPVEGLTAEEEENRFYPSKHQLLVSWEEGNRVVGVECERCSGDTCLGFCYTETGLQVCLECADILDVKGMRTASELKELQGYLKDWGPLPEACLCGQEGLLGGEVKEVGRGDLILDDCVPPIEDSLGKPVKVATSGQLIIGNGKEMEPTEAVSYLEKNNEATRLEAARKGLVCAKVYNGVVLYEGVREELRDVRQMALQPEPSAIGWLEEGYGELALGELVWGNDDRPTPSAEGPAAASGSLGSECHIGEALTTITGDDPVAVKAAEVVQGAPSSGEHRPVASGSVVTGKVHLVPVGVPEGPSSGTGGSNQGGELGERGVSSSLAVAAVAARAALEVGPSFATVPPQKRAKREHHPRPFLLSVSSRVLHFLVLSCSLNDNADALANIGT